jgi:HEAT repeat protein
VATQTLVQIGEVAIAKLVKEFLKEDQSENRRYKIAVALAESKSDAALTCFLDALNDQRSLIRFLAANGLGNLMRMEGIEGLITIAHDPDVVVRTEVIRALGDLGWVARDNANNPVIKPLIYALNNDVETDVRSFAARGLGIIGSGAGVSALINALHDPEPSVRIAAASALGRIRDP